jgi:hypothetical protein
MYSPEPSPSLSVRRTANDVTVRTTDQAAMARRLASTRGTQLPIIVLTQQ